MLGAAEPITAPLVPHGEAATRRRYVRALIVPGLVTVAAVALVITGDAPWETVLLGPLAIAVGLVLAADRARTLGHALVAGHLVARAGSLVRRRVALETQAVIGWNFADTWFQRRVGLTTLVATMAGGRQSVTVLDVPEATGVALARDAVPGLVEQFLALAQGPAGHVLEVPAEVAEAHPRVDPLGHRGGLESRRGAAAVPRLVQERRGDRVPIPRRRACSSVVTL